MPTTTFLNLPEEKRQRIIQSAIEEYSRVPASEVSIKNIVTSAGIPRGSFYTYFEDKEDLANFLLQEYRETFDRKIREVFQAEQGDLFQAIPALHDSILQYMTKIQYLKMIFRNLNAGIDQDLLDNMAYRDRASHVTDTMREMLNPQNLQAQDEEAIYDMLEILVMLLRSSIAKAVVNHWDCKTASEQFRRKIKLLKRGMCKST